MRTWITEKKLLCLVSWQVKQLVTNKLPSFSEPREVTRSYDSFKFVDPQVFSPLLTRYKVSLLQTNLSPLSITLITKSRIDKYHLPVTLMNLLLQEIYVWLVKLQL